MANIKSKKSERNLGKDPQPSKPQPKLCEKLEVGMDKSDLSESLMECFYARGYGNAAEALFEIGCEFHRIAGALEKIAERYQGTISSEKTESTVAA